MRRLLFIILTILTISTRIFAQETIIVGEVYDANKELVGWT
jgi:hypothetical protein